MGKPTITGHLNSGYVRERNLNVCYADFQGTDIKKLIKTEFWFYFYFRLVRNVSDKEKY